MNIEEQIAKLNLSAGEEPIIYQALAKKAPQVPPKPNKKPGGQDVSKTPLVSQGLVKDKQGSFNLLGFFRFHEVQM